MNQFKLLVIVLFFTENPYPQQGDILTIKLSENTETMQAIDGTYKPMTVEMYFQMNYGTGEWKRIQQIREVDVEYAQ